jgi:hypothetical protein
VSSPFYEFDAVAAFNLLLERADGLLTEMTRIADALEAQLRRIADSLGEVKMEVERPDRPDS